MQANLTAGPRVHAAANGQTDVCVSAAPFGYASDRADMRRPEDDAGAGGPASSAAPRASSAACDPSVSRRGFLAGAATVTSVGFAGCGGRLPTTTTADSVVRRDDATVVWEYPASAVRGDEDGEAIGYAAIEFDVSDRARNADEVLPTLAFALNSTVGPTSAGEGSQGYQADRFRFRIGVPRTYDNTSGFRALVRPNQWPTVSTTYGYDGGERALVVTAADVNTEGTITVDGQFRSTDPTLPRRLRCGFEVQASQEGPLGRTVTVDGRTTLDVSTLDLPEGITTG